MSGAPLGLSFLTCKAGPLMPPPGAVVAGTGGDDACEKQKQDDCSSQILLANTPATEHGDNLMEIALHQLDGHK